VKGFPSPQTLSANILKSGSFKPQVGLFVCTVHVNCEASGVTLCFTVLYSQHVSVWNYGWSSFSKVSSVPLDISRDISLLYCISRPVFSSSFVIDLSAIDASSLLGIEAAYIYLSTGRYIEEGLILQPHRCDNIKSCTVLSFSKKCIKVRFIDN
jgi:hypothetical protein